MATGAGQVALAIANFTNDYNSKVASNISLINGIVHNKIKQGFSDYKNLLRKVNTFSAGFLNIFTNVFR